ncbi:uncharacterized protein LOC106717217 isoform X1 [Papilio machaon]|uniref:uncharacterized protein LOC106717217 isoform X1 n=1 Tax=Papilio machaon TaxID=76193 RepID=UPI0006EB2690|nr:uncharacterized protein LOC106717217 isoform X1 [Papilio machaon]
MAHTTIFLSILLLSFFANTVTPNQICKIVLPHKLRYLENMLNAEVIAKAAKLRQRMEANPNIQDSEKNWPILLAKFQTDEKYKKLAPYSYNNIYGRRIPNL